MTIFRDQERSFDASEVVGVRLCRSPHGNLHSGIGYGASGKVKNLHLGWENTLQNDWSRIGYWVSPDADPLLLGRVPAKCRRIWKAFRETEKFTYGLGYRGVRFNKAGLPQVRGRGFKGLSCTTFVVAVFESVGVYLLDPETWPIRIDEDVAHVEGLAPPCEKHPGLYERLLAEAQEGVVRIQPLELLGASACAGTASFEDACAAVEGLPALPECRNERLTKHFGAEGKSIEISFEVTQDPGAIDGKPRLSRRQRDALVESLKGAWEKKYHEPCPDALVQPYEERCEGGDAP